MQSMTRARSLAVGLFAGLAIAAGGWWVGSQLRPADLDRIAPEGALMEVHLADGSVYLGSITPSGDSWILSEPAIVVPAASEDDATTFQVTPLSDEPSAIAGPILIQGGAVRFIGGVRAGSAIEAAYRQVMATTDEASPDASP